jgi:hypothetical protein
MKNTHKQNTIHKHKIHLPSSSTNTHTHTHNPQPIYKLKKIYINKKVNKLTLEPHKR